MAEAKIAIIGGTGLYSIEGAKVVDSVDIDTPFGKTSDCITLAKIGDERAIPVLFEALDDSSALIEYWASEGLEKMGVGMVFYKPK